MGQVDENNLKIKKCKRDLAEANLAEARVALAKAAAEFALAEAEAEAAATTTTVVPTTTMKVECGESNEPLKLKIQTYKLKWNNNVYFSESKLFEVGN